MLHSSIITVSVLKGAKNSPSSSKSSIEAHLNFGDAAGSCVQQTNQSKTDFAQDLIPDNKPVFVRRHFRKPAKAAAPVVDSQHSGIRKKRTVSSGVGSGLFQLGPAPSAASVPGGAMKP